MWPLTINRSKKPFARRGAKQARSLKRRRRFRIFLRGSSVVVVLSTVMAAGYIWQGGLFGSWLREAADRLNREVATAGFAVEDVRITGQKNTSLKQIRAALGVADNPSMTSLDLAAMLGRVDALPWVKKATISRIMPNILQVTISEHQAAALWQDQGRFYLVNQTGEIITGAGLEKYSALPQIVGYGANKHLPDILKKRQKHPDLFARIKSSVWVGNRRWDLNYNNGIKVKLPETGADRAWDKLYHYNQRQKILTREILVIDLRLPEKTIVRLTPQEAERRRLILETGRKEESI